VRKILSAQNKHNEQKKIQKVILDRRKTNEKRQMGEGYKQKKKGRKKNILIPRRFNCWNSTVVNCIDIRFHQYDKS
jgi:hypothetical protein